MEDDRQREWAASLARRGVAAVAPQELDLFDETSAAFFALPPKARTAPSKEPLGMGLEVAEAIVSAVALGVAVDVVTQLSTRALDAAGGRVKSRLGRLLRRSKRDRVRQDESLPLPAPLPPERLADLREIAVERAKALGLSDDQAELLADAIIGGLAVSGAPDPEPGTAPGGEPTAPARE
ncbi:hypothetical protein [Actinomadura miaoliensis]|uniref:Uncharacterized protein n=1 Tax=Actinomadura miaoliensis TaxID=430685 RepID=A0ABP7W6X4_9ACTN